MPSLHGIIKALSELALLCLIAAAGLLALTIFMDDTRRETSNEQARLPLVGDTAIPFAPLGEEEGYGAGPQDAALGALLANIELKPNEGFSLESRRDVAHWTIFTAVKRVHSTGDVSTPSGLVVLARREAGQWVATMAGTATFLQWLREVPDELLSQEERAFYGGR